MKNTKHRENETMANFNDFISKLKTPGEKHDNSQSWMARPLQFQVTSDKAYTVQKAKEYEETLGTGKNFE